MRESPYIRRHKIKCFCGAGCKMYFLDGPWVNEGHKISKSRIDPTGKNKMQAFLSALSSGITEHTSKERGPLLCILFADRVL
jgi:hypothetical protein